MRMSPRVCVGTSDGYYLRIHADRDHSTASSAGGLNQFTRNDDGLEHLDVSLFACGVHGLRLMCQLEV